MASSKISKGPLAVDGSVITIFNYRGCHFEKSWAIDQGSGALFQCAPSPASPMIEDMLQVDIKAGQADRIAAIEVNPYTAICLYLEGKITPEHIQNAEIAEESEYIVFTGIRFRVFPKHGIRPAIDPTKPFTIVVRQNLECQAMTVDKNGKEV